MKHNPTLFLLALVAALALPAAVADAQAPVLLRDVDFLDMNRLVEVDGKLLFTSLDAATGTARLWQSEGTAATTVPLHTFPIVGGEAPGRLVAADGKLFFIGSDGTSGWELWIYDGTTTTSTNPGRHR